MATRRTLVVSGVAIFMVAVVLGTGAFVGRAGAARQADRGAAPAVIDVPSDAHRIRKLAAGGDQTCAVYVSGAVACWGPGSLAALDGGADGDPSTDPNARIGELVPDAKDAVDIALGDCSGCALDAAGRLSCWGYKSVCNSPAAILMPRATPIAAVPPLRALESEGMGSGMCGVGATDGQKLHCWYVWTGSNWFGDPPQTTFQYVPPEKATYRGAREADGALTGAVQLTVATMGSRCARYADGRVRCWSEGLTNGENKPFASLAAPAEPAIAMHGGFTDQCFVLRSGAVECHSTDGVQRPPFAFAGGATSVASGGNMICATGRDGTIACFEYSWAGQPPREVHHKAVAIASGGAARSIVGGTHHFCILREDDAVLCWSAYREGPPARITLP